MAKSVEDTAFYRYLPVASANEVGGDPGDPVVSIDALPRPQRATSSEQWPEDHDHAVDPRHQAERRRPGPARRLPVGPRPVARVPPPVVGVVRRRVDRRPGPRATTALLLQTVVGAWPIDARPARRATWRRPRRRPSVRTSWTDPDPDVRRRRRPPRRRLLADDDASSREVGELVPTMSRPRPPHRAAPSSCCSSPARASRTATRAASCGTSAWSTPTTAGRSTTALRADGR